MRKSQNGFTFAEVIIAIIVIAISAVLFERIIQSSWFAITNANQTMLAAHLIEQQVETLRTQIAQTKAFPASSSSTSQGITITTTISNASSIVTPFANLPYLRKLCVTATWSSPKSGSLTINTYLAMHFLADSGFTLLEALIALAISGIIIVGLMFLYKSTVTANSVQKQETEMNQNAQYAIKRIAEVLEEAGAYLPETQYTIVWYTSVSPNSTSDFNVIVNPKMGTQVFQTALASATNFPVNASTNFVLPGNIFKINLNTTSSPVTYTVTDTSGGKLTLSTPVSFAANDAIYSYTTNRYYLNNNNLCVDIGASPANVIAENITNLSVVFYDATATITNQWAAMKSAMISITASTAFLSPNKSITLTMTFRLRNR